MFHSLLTLIYMLYAYVLRYLKIDPFKKN